MVTPKTLMKNIVILATCIFFSSRAMTSEFEEAPPIVRTFQSDQCTFWPDSSFSKDWSHCCVQHDLYYWAGGSEKARESVDQELKSCIQESSGPLNARLMFLGVRLGSLSPVKFGGKQWGNAWGNDVRKTHLRSNEIQKLKNALLSTLPHDMSYSDIDIFVENLENQNSSTRK